MYVPRGYERLFNGRRMAPRPMLDNFRTASPPWGTQPIKIKAAGQTTVGTVTSQAVVPIAILGFVSLVGGAVVGWKFVRGKGWGRR